MDEFDRKVIDAFPGKSVRKDLTSLMKKGANVPTYVLEYLLGMYCTTDDEEEMKIGLEKIKKILSENYVRPDQSDHVKSKIKENGQYTVIDKVTVRLDEKEDKYIASFTNLDLKDLEVNSDLVTHNEKLLVGGIWCIIKIEYVGLDKEEEEEEYEEDIFDGNKKKRGKKLKKKKSKYDSPFAIAALKPIQMANLDLDEIIEARRQFTKDEVSVAEVVGLFSALANRPVMPSLVICGRVVMSGETMPVITMLDEIFVSAANAGAKKYFCPRTAEAITICFPIR